MFVIRHPRPSYPKHMLIVPKRNARTFVALTQQAADWTEAVRGAARSVAALGEVNPETAVLCVNGGRRQEVRQVHFHLFEGTPRSSPSYTLDAVLARLRKLEPRHGYTVFVTNAFDHASELRFALDVGDLTAADASGSRRRVVRWFDG